MHFLKQLCVVTAALGLGAGAQAQSTATDPIFVQRIAVLAGSDTHAAFSADTVSVYRGLVELSENGTLSLANLPQWAAGSLAGTQPYHLVVLSGDLEGASFDIVGNAAGTVSIEAGNYDLSRLAEGTLVQIQPAWTINDVAALAELPEGASLVLQGHDPLSGASVNEIFMLFNDYGWIDMNMAPAGNLPLGRAEGFIINLPAQVQGSELVVIGQVPLSAQRALFAVSGKQKTTEYRFGLLGTEPALLDGFDFGGEVELMAYSNEEPGVNKLPEASYMYIEGWGWFDMSFNEVGSSVLLEPGKSYRVRHYGNGSDHLRELVWLPDYLN